LFRYGQGVIDLDTEISDFASGPSSNNLQRLTLAGRANIDQIAIHEYEFSRGNGQPPSPGAWILRTKMEMTLPRKIMLLVVPLAAALTSQAAAAAEHHHTRTRAHAVPTEQRWNSNAYDAPGYNSYNFDAPGYGGDRFDSPGSLAGRDEGAMSGADH
jgi:hypothetical protein